jgi:trans-aconitate 2-methyltransferase
MTDQWNPALYMKFDDERTRAARDLLAQVPLKTARSVFDLGCGPGNSAELLLARFPDAHVVGLDTSEAMLAHARRRAPGATFVNRDIAEWAPETPPDLVFANAALHFLPDHQDLFPRLFASLAPGGCFAVQMPDTLREASHAAMRLVAADGPWADRLIPIAKSRPLIADIDDYYEWLRPAAATLDCWTTIYMHALDGPAGVAEWFAGSGLRPFLAPLTAHETEQFLERYRREIADAYPARSEGTILLAYPRLFIVAVKR